MREITLQRTPATHSIRHTLASVDTGFVTESETPIDSPVYHSIRVSCIICTVGLVVLVEKYRNIQHDCASKNS